MAGAGGRGGRTLIGAALTVVGAALWLLSAVVSRGEHHSFTDGGPPPEYVHLTSGGSYSLAIPGGVPASRRVGVDPAALSCSATLRTAGSTRLTTTPETNPKALQRIASFTSTVTGDVQVACAGLNEVYVDDADGSGDPGGLLIVLASIALAVGLPLLLSGLAGRGSRAPVSAAGQPSAGERIDPTAEGTFELQGDGDGDVVVARHRDGLDAQR